MTFISSPSNPRLKQVVALRRRRVRDESGLTVVEGRDEIGLALDAGARVQTLFVCPEVVPDDAAAVSVQERVADSGSEVVEVSRAAFEKIAYREGPDGLLALVPALRGGLDDLDLPASPLLLICEGIEKPGNLGAMVRTADAAGVDAVIAVDPITDWGNPNVVRSSKGTIFAVPVASATLAEALGWLEARGIRLIATTPSAQAVHTDISYAGGVAIAIGTEKWGLTDEALAGAAERVRIPMHGVVNSLNASASAAIVTYEAVRQRSEQ